MADFSIGRDDRQTVRTIRTRAGDARTLVIDFGLWADDYSAVTSCAWTVPYGTAATSGASLASSVATVTVTTTAAGSSLIRATATDATHTVVVDIQILTEDQSLTMGPSDYWPACC